MPDQAQQPTIQRIREVIIRARIESTDPATGQLVKVEFSPEILMLEGDFTASMNNFLMSRGVGPDNLGLAAVRVNPSPVAPTATSTTAAPLEVVSD